MKKTLILCLTILAWSALADDKDVSWVGDWKFVPTSPSEKCCYIQRDVTFRSRDEGKVYPDINYESSKACSSLGVSIGYQRSTLSKKTMDIKDHTGNLTFTLAMDGDSATFSSIQGEQTCTGNLHRTQPEDWHGLWQLEALSKSEKCCYFKPLVSIDCKSLIWCQVEGHYEDTETCWKLGHSQVFKYKALKDRALDFDYSSTMKFNAQRTKETVADLVGKMNGEECPATLKLDNKAIAISGVYKLVSDPSISKDACCPKEAVTIKQEDDKTTVEGSWEDNEACKKSGLEGAFEKEGKVNLNIVTAKIPNKDNVNVPWELTIRVWPNATDFSIQTQSGICRSKDVDFERKKPVKRTRSQTGASASGEATQSTLR